MSVFAKISGGLGQSTTYQMPNDFRCAGTSLAQYPCTPVSIPAQTAIYNLYNAANNLVAYLNSQGHSITMTLPPRTTINASTGSTLLQLLQFFAQSNPSPLMSTWLQNLQANVASWVTSVDDLTALLTSLRPGQTAVTAMFVPSSAPQCGAGMSMVNGRCTVVSCPPGTIANSVGQCVPGTAGTVPSGKGAAPRVIMTTRTSAPSSCPPGQVWATAAIGPGQVPTGQGQCVPMTNTTPTQTQATPVQCPDYAQNCQPINADGSCPSGFVPDSPSATCIPATSLQPLSPATIAPGMVLSPLAQALMSATPDQFAAQWQSLATQFGISNSDQQDMLNALTAAINRQPNVYVPPAAYGMTAVTTLQNLAQAMTQIPYAQAQAFIAAAQATVSTFPWLYVGIGAAVLLGLGVGAWWLLSPSDQAQAA